MSELKFKQSFIDRFSSITNFDSFAKACSSHPRKSLRINTLKISVSDCIKRLSFLKLEPVPWCSEGFWFENFSDTALGNSVEHSLGYIYIQDASSMIPPIVLDPKPGDRILDLCASPGSKASQIAMFMNNSGVLVANDSGDDRLTALGTNMQRMGVLNCILTNMRGDKMSGEFDKILLDAPCSGSGTIMKSPRTVLTWNPGIVDRLSRLQKMLLSHSWGLLKSGGTLVYSTCSVDPVEDEGVINFARKNLDGVSIEKISLPVKSSPAIVSFQGENFDHRVNNCLRIWPQDNGTEGFFIAKLRKS
ncbi:RsmB/NOP family class I SAM-dependent RNA methyltransferase [Candidatus Woesearchaeota archaeon]|nr:RsmB/NOP family class I SAM-dependent RNA methyltransferase [Candidatus Woesearchaeota archaeon]